MQERLRDPRYSQSDRFGPTTRPRRRSWVDRATDERHGVGRVNLIVLGASVLAVAGLVVR